MVVFVVEPKFLNFIKGDTTFLEEALDVRVKIINYLHLNITAFGSDGYKKR